MFKGLKNNSLKKSPLRPHRNWEERCDDQWSVNKIKKKIPHGVLTEIGRPTTL
jgi:hypothetical protein